MFYILYFKFNNCTTPKTIDFKKTGHKRFYSIDQEDVSKN